MNGNGLSRDELMSLRERLEAEKSRLEDELDAYVENGLYDGWKDSLSELSAYDNHPADAGTETFDRGKDIALMDNARILLAQTNLALEAIHNGTYGLCQNCHNPIDPARLTAFPQATLCAHCKDEEEHAASPEVGTRPIEESVIEFPFGNSPGDDNVAFDGEDAWQKVASYGTANSPQDDPDAIEYDDTYYNADEDWGLVEEVDGIIDPRSGESDFPDVIYDLSQDNPHRRPHETPMRGVRSRNPSQPES